MRKKLMSIGVENFKDIMEKDLYYVDKTVAIKDIPDAGAGDKYISRQEVSGDFPIAKNGKTA